MDTDDARRRLEADRARLNGLIHDLQDEVDGETESETSELADYDQHPADSGSDTFEREKDLSILDGLALLL